MSYCPQCGTTVDHEDSFCRDCGRPLGVPQTMHSARRSGTAELGLLLAAILLLALAAGVLIGDVGREGWTLPGSRWMQRPRPFPCGFAPPTSSNVV